MPAHSREVLLLKQQARQEEIEQWEAAEQLGKWEAENKEADHAAHHLGNGHLHSLSKQIGPDAMMDAFNRAVDQAQVAKKHKMPHPLRSLTLWPMTPTPCFRYDYNSIFSLYFWF